MRYVTLAAFVALCLAYIFAACTQTHEIVPAHNEEAVTKPTSVLILEDAERNLEVFRFCDQGFTVYLVNKAGHAVDLEITERPCI